mmetsp:Transcript_11362/g.13452  ORF Transcript_11362/g.13452 Transcript_11362/m.13452 type:complete len:789 (+) Transcript_11362:72-2438(+)|eukprot:CAMPEP_0197852900 /NCGR_PEP_ID=MMETSP1438-20131217/21664_1 /TAXON_ID=1461541 /ORGANISM="Pterosperma sp., Strain CCMP1384" /LENGTH=788 /DNA_ID=CAMNT_0043467121 /DNA_START=72 /DNA_END=2438 /DNA_ORIENTATION=+
MVSPYDPPVGTVFFSDTFTYIFIIFSVLAGFAFGIYQWWVVSLTKVGGPREPSTAHTHLMPDDADADAVAKAKEIQELIQEGADAFLFSEYKIICYFMVVFALVIFLLLGSAGSHPFAAHPKGGSHYPAAMANTTYPDVIWAGQDKKPAVYGGVFSMISFLTGATTSLVSGWAGMKIATYGNARTTLEARKGIETAFIVAFRSGSVMGFLLSACGIIMLFLLVCIYKSVYSGDWRSMFEAIAGYGLGGSSIALFGRVGGGIYTKAADVGADLVGKVEQNIPEDDPRNPAVIADNVGDNVGDIAGMGSDLFGSFAESTCAALVLSSVTSLGHQENFTAMMYPLLLSAGSILVCIVTTLIATNLKPARNVEEIEPALKLQMIVSCFLMAIVSFGLTMGALPENIMGLKVVDGMPHEVKNYHVFFCVACGLFTGLMIGLCTEYYTSNAYQPVKEVADSCKTGAATNVIFGLALGYKSCIVPIFGLAITIFVSYELCNFYGVAVAAIGMLGTLATGLAIDAYGPISDNAGGIAEMSGMEPIIRERTDALDAAGNTTAAIGKGFAIGSAGLVSLALFGSYVTTAGLAENTTSLLNCRVYAGLLVGAMLPYWFSALTMKSVGVAALAMVEEVRRQFHNIPGLMEGTAKADYKSCIMIATDASLVEMIAPGALVMLTPPITGILFGTKCLAGVLAGSLVSGIQIAISASNTGGAWDNAKKFIEAGRSDEAKALGPKGSEAHKAAVVGDTVGDPLKDTSGPALNILIKLMAVESLVFAPFFKASCANGEGFLFQYF